MVASSRVRQPRPALGRRASRSACPPPRGRENSIGRRCPVRAARGRGSRTGPPGPRGRGGRSSRSPFGRTRGTRRRCRTQSARSRARRARSRRRSAGRRRRVIEAHAGVVAPDDEVGAAVVLAADRVPDGLTQPRVAHGRREGGEHDPVVRVVALHQHAVAVHARVGRDVVGLRLTDQRMQQQPVDHLERALGEVLVSAVDRVARLKARRGANRARRTCAASRSGRGRGRERLGAGARTVTLPAT